ncbi:MAG: hypothetical protein IH571_00050, partial [Acholeplasmataceae bacterium]|nr:hypothetical protein [Acholeplasmataceae bacterium]
MKKLAWLKFIIIWFFIGFFFSFLLYTGTWYKIRTGLGSVSILSYILLFPAMFYLTLTLHELSHFISFRCQGIRLRAIYITIFVFYRTEKGWKVTIKPKLWVLFGGLVVPDLSPIETEEDYQSTARKFSMSLLVAPIVTISFACATLLMMIMVLAFSNQTGLIGHLLVSTVYVLAFSSVYTLSFFLSNDAFYGDFVAFRKMKTDLIFQLVQINQYLMFSLQNHEKTNDFLWKKIELAMIETNLSNALFHTMLVNNYLEGVVYNEKTALPEIDLKLNGLNIHGYMSKEQGLQTAYELCHYHYLRKDVKKAYELFDRIQRRANKKLPEKLLEYLKRKTSHVMH